MTTKKPVLDDGRSYDPEQAAYEYELDNGHKKLKIDNSASKPAYGAAQLVSLSDIEHIRMRPNLSLGPYETQKLTALREPIDNSIDEFRSGHGKKIKITIHEDGAASIEDSGRGVPFDVNEFTGENGIYMAFGKSGSGGKFGAENSGYAGTSSLGLNGVGTTATNATSLRFDVTVYRDGKKHRLSFKEGIPGHWSAENGPNDKFTPKNEVVHLKDDRTPAEKKERPTGTTIKFWADPTIFGENATFRINELREVLRFTAFLVPGICIEIDDRCGEIAIASSEEESRPAVEPQHDIYEFDGGISEMLDLVSPDSHIHDIISIKSNEGSFKEKSPVPQKDGTIKTEEVERFVDIDIAFRYGNGYEYTVRSFVNTIHTSLNGVHVSAFERALSKVLISSIKEARGLLKAKEEPPVSEDVKEGLSVIVSIGQNEPSFVGQEKALLSGTNTQRVVQAEVTKKINQWVADKKNAKTLKVMQEKIVDSMRVRIAQRQQKETARKANALESSALMPSKLVACGESDARYIELQICEGDSALGGLKLARDARYQAIYPLKGKPKNVFDQSLSTALDNGEISDMVKIIGAGVGKGFELDQMKYKRIIMLADADSDGSHIRVLLIGFMYRFMRPLIEDGRLYAAMPPLFSVTTTGKTKEKLFAHTNEELEKIIAKLKSSNRGFSKPTRHKGLGEYDSDILESEVMNPETRLLRRITLHEAELAADMMKLTLGKDPKGPEKRRAWILDERTLVSNDEIDA